MAASASTTSMNACCCPVRGARAASYRRRSRSRCSRATSPRSGIFGASGSFKEGGGDAAAAGAVSPRFAAVKWPRWLALSQSDAKPE